jgi:hypothetical protein
VALPRATSLLHDTTPSFHHNLFHGYYLFQARFAPGQSKLTAVPVGSGYRITTLRLEEECVLEFQIPKNERQMIEQGTELSRLVTISGGKG